MTTAREKIILGWPMVVALLVVHYLLCVGAVREKSTTFDEIAFLTGGYSYWKTGDYRLSPDGGMLPQRWAALPLVAGDCKFPSREQSGWWASSAWDIGRQFFYEQGNDLDAMLLRARAMMALLGVGLGLVIYFWSRQLFGQRGAIISLALYAFCPSLLANGALVTADLAAALFFTVAVWMLWVVLHRVSVVTVAGSVMTLAMLFLSKMSAVLILPMAALMLAARLMSQRPLAVAVGAPRQVTGCGRRFLVFLGVVLVQIAAVTFVIWACYGFRYSAFTRAEAGRDQLKDGGWEAVRKDAGATGTAVDFARRHKLLPEAYLFGFQSTLAHAQTRRAFLNGEYSLSGWWYFFPVSFLVKTPLATLVLLGLAAVAGWGARARLDLYRFAPLLVLLAVYWAFAIGSHLNIGHRHLLPTYPALLILTGAVAVWWERRAPRVCVCVLMALAAAESLSVWPHSLAFFNLAVGGPRHGYRWMVDSSLDWGQDLPGLKRWLDRNGLSGQGQTPVYLSYFGTGSPEYYGINASGMPRFSDCRRQKNLDPLRGGVYCISASMLESVFTTCWGRWAQPYEQAYQNARAMMNEFYRAKDDPAAREQRMRDQGESHWQQIFAAYEQLRFGRLCAYLRQREPDAQVGYSILVYRLSDEEVRRALEGPPAELSPMIQISGILQ